jgi:hypothetical protein
MTVQQAHHAGPRLEVREPDSGHVPIDTIRAVFTYTIALIVVAGGLLMLFLTRSEPASADLRVIIATLVGSALTFTFGQEVSTRTARQAASSTAASTAATTATIAAANSGVGPSTNTSPAP